MFGQSSQQQGSMFGQAGSQSSSVFGQTGSQPGSVFGQTGSQSSSVFGQTGSSSFGSSSAATSMFGKATGGFSTSPGFGSPLATSQQNVSFGQTTPFGATGAFGQPQTTTSVTSLFGQGSGFGGAGGFGQPQSTSTSATSPFGQRSPAGGFSPASTASPGLFGQTSPRPSLFGQSSSVGQTTSTSTLFGQPVFASSSGTTAPLTSFAFVKTTASGIFGSGVSSAFHSTATAPSVFGQTPQTSTVSFGKSSGQPSAFGQPSSTAAGLFGQSSGFSQQKPTASGIFSQQTTATVTPFGQSSAFGQPATTASSVSAFGTGDSAFGTRGGASRTQSDVKPTATGLFGKGFDETATTTTVQSRTRLVSGGFSGLFGRKEGSKDMTEKDMKPSLFGKQSASLGVVKQEPENHYRPRFGKRSSVGDDKDKRGESQGIPQYSALFGKTIKTEGMEKKGPFELEGTSKRGLFGKEIPSSETEEISKRGLFGKGAQPSGSEETSRKGLFGKNVDSQQALKVGDESSEPTRGTTRTFKDERPTGSEQPRRSLGLFGRLGTKPASKGLFGKESPNDDSDRDTDESQRRGFRPRLARVQEDTGDNKPLFGKRVPPSAGPVRQTSRKSRSSDEGLKSRPGSVSRQMSEDLSRRVAIICKNVPSKFNNHITLRNHFCRYGKVTKVFPNPAKMQATIHFDRHEQAADAKRRGRILARGYPPLTIFWSSYLAPLTPSPSREPVQRTDAEVPGPFRRSAWKRGDGINDELDSMSGTSDISYDRRKSPSPGPSSPGSRSPQKRVRSASPVLATSVDRKSDPVVQLASFQGQVAKTTADKVHLLDIRDKYMRQNVRKRSKDMKKSFVGTCPDMCPEKERYDREDKRRLSYYEMVPGSENIPGRNPVVDHSRAVKEYLRSSPDQDEPLPHELRPLPVLEMTMTYLLCEIADQGQDGYWADWFDFLWNRTRGIRKDITQQQLCDRGAVELIEKCVRFHIFCSERLCEEDMHSFDAKINNENLTKCLQTLREFYHDLERKQKVFCPNEAEFRAYTVLMNLNEGDILREVQQLRPEVRSSPQINFVLQVYSALNSNNYVRFFRLVKQASFSSACIMHRYFTQVRNRALTSMMRTYGMGNKPAQIPLSELVRLLGFENEQEASDFSEHYGFMVEDGCVILDKNDYLEPDTAWLPRRSVTLIESKRMVSVGEMINGGALPRLNLPQPSSSFDEMGRFRSAVELPKSQVSSEAVQQVLGAEVRGHVEVKQEPVSKATKLETAVASQPPKIAFTNEHVKDTAKLLFWEVIDEMCPEIGREEMEEVQTLLDIGQSVLENTVYSTVNDFAQSISQEVHDHAKAECERALKLEQEERLGRVADILKEELIEEIVKERVHNLATIEIREVKAQLKRECIARVTEEINLELVQEVMSEMVLECASNVYEIDVVQRLRELQELEGIVKLSRAGKFFKKWKKEYVAVTKLKRAMMAFPSAPAMDSLGSQLDSLVPNRRDDNVTESGFYVNQMARLSVETPVQVEERRKRLEIHTTIQSLYKRLMVTRAWLPLDLNKLVGKKLADRYGKSLKGSKKICHLSWKLVLYLPEIDTSSTSLESRATALQCDWLKAKLSKGKKPQPETVLKTEVLSLYRTKVGTLTSTSPAVTLGLCVRSISGLPSEDELLLLEEERCMLGTSGILFVLPANPPMDDPYSEYWYSNIQRLQELLEMKPSNQEFPLVILVAASTNQDVSYNSLSERLNLDQFIEQGFICDVKVVVLEFDEHLHQGIDVVKPEVCEKLSECMDWLSDLSNPPPDLTVSYLRDCIDRVLMEHYYTPVLQNLRKRKFLGHVHQGLEELLELYNAVIQHLCDTVTSENLLNLSWPVAEFTRHETSSTPPPHWNTEDQFEYLHQLIGSLKLPLFVCFWEPASWEQVREKVYNYVETVVDHQSGPARITLMSRLNKMLKQVEAEFEDTCYLTEGLESCEPTYDCVPWTDLVSMCIDYRLATVDFMDPCINSRSCADEEIIVAYYPSELENFVPPHTWRHIESEQSILEKPSVEGLVRSAAEKVREKLTECDSTSQDETVTDQENVPPAAKETKTSSSLLLSLQAERRRSDHFQKFLENALKSDQDSVLFQEMPGEINIKNQDNNSPVVSIHESEWKSVDTGMFRDTLATAESREFSVLDKDLNISMATRIFGNQSIHFNDESCFGDREQLSGERKRKSFGHTPPNAKRLSQGIKKDTLTESDLDLSALSGRARKQRLSDIYGNDKVMFALCEPSVEDSLDSLKNGIKSNRRESDLFEEKLLAALKSDPFTL